MFLNKPVSYCVAITAIIESCLCETIVAIDSNSVLNVNVTSCLLEQWSQTSRKWAEDYQKQPT